MFILFVLVFLAGVFLCGMALVLMPFIILWDLVAESGAESMSMMAGMPQTWGALASCLIGTVLGIIGIVKVVKLIVACVKERSAEPCKGHVVKPLGLLAGAWATLTLALLLVIWSFVQTPMAARLTDGDTYANGFEKSIGIIVDGMTDEDSETESEPEA